MPPPVLEDLLLQQALIVHHHLPAKIKRHVKHKLILLLYFFLPRSTILLLKLSCRNQDVIAIVMYSALQHIWEVQLKKE